jgi:hypothetical protein
MSFSVAATPPGKDAVHPEDEVLPRVSGVALPPVAAEA